MLFELGCPNKTFSTSCTLTLFLIIFCMHYHSMFIQILHHFTTQITFLQVLMKSSFVNFQLYKSFEFLRTQVTYVDLRVMNQFSV